jgi:outer membrane immunogenic protein
MHRIVFASLAALGVTVGAASAADLGRPAPAPVYTKAPAIAPSLGWTGCYLGGNGGGAWVHNKDDDGSDTKSGAIGGGQVGCDYQTGAFVFGVQGMFDWADLKGSHAEGLDTINTDTKYLATATGRIGYALQPPFLVYAKGGAAWTRNDITLDPAGDTDKLNRLGWTAGAGAEYMFAPNWSLFAEYNFASFGSKTLDFSTPVNAKQDIQSAVAGINFHLKPY